MKSSAIEYLYIGLSYQQVELDQSIIKIIFCESGSSKLMRTKLKTNQSQNIITYFFSNRLQMKVSKTRRE